MKIIAIALTLLLLSACSVQTTGVNGKPLDLAGSARDRVAIAAEYLSQGDSENAQRQLTKALSLDSNSADAHSMMGVLLERDGDAIGAERSYKKSLKLRADDSRTHNNYAIFLFKNARYKDALKQFKAASDDLAYDRRAQAFEGLGLSALQVNNPELAAHAFERALKLDDSLANSTLEVGVQRFADGDFDSAQRFYKRYLELTQSSAQSAKSLWLGIRLARRNGDKNALSSYELALKNLYPSSAEYKLYQASLKPAS